MQDSNWYLSNGEIMLINRSLRYYINSEQAAIQSAVVHYKQTKREKDRLHMEDVKRQASAHIDAATKLLNKLRQRSTEDS